MSNSLRQQTRRNLLASISGTGAAAIITGLLPQTATANEERNITVLGSFESGKDGWQTNGRNELERIEKRERPAAVVEGSHGLMTIVNGDSYPMIENKKRVLQADIVTHPYLFASVTPSDVSDTDSKVSFKFRLNHSTGTTNSGGSGSQGNTRSKSANVVESEPTEVRPLSRSLLTWDLSEIDNAKLKKAKRLEIIWYPTDFPPSGSSRGHGKDLDYRGDVVFDDIHLSDSRTQLSSVKLARDFQDLQFEHGQYQDTDITFRDETYESGKFVFASGAKVKYAFEELDSGRFEITIGNNTYQIGEGWE